MLFKDYCNYLQSIESISSRNEITVILAELFKKLDRTELSAGIYLLQGRVTPPFIDLEFNFSTKLLIRSLSDLDEEREEIKLQYGRLGDIGLLMESRAQSEGGVINVLAMFKKLLEIATVRGKDSQAIKSKLSQEVLKNLSSVEAKYYSRIILGKLRLGVSDKTILDGISWAVMGDKSLKSKLESAYGARADLPAIAESTLFDGIESLSDYVLEVGVPVSSKLVEREKSFEKLYERMGKGHLVQPKYDGLRLQIHFRHKGFTDEFSKLSEQGTKEQVRLFSRNMANITNMFPDVVTAVKKLGIQSAIIDSEVIGIDPETGKFMPFQDTVQRKRKYDVSNKVLEIPVRAYCFDLLYLNGKSLLETPLEKRLSLMKNNVFSKINEVLELTESIEINSVNELEEKFNAYKSMGLEGLIAKLPYGKYEPGTRNYEWIKQKVKAQDSMADSIDAVVLGYYRGEGVRTKFGIGAILVGLYDPDQDTYLSLAKVGTGFKDDDWSIIKRKIDKIAVEDLPENVLIDKTLIPDTICKPELVVLIEADQVSRSKVHGSGDTRFSLRFPRYKGMRLDKNSQQATTINEAKRLNELV